MAVIMTLCNEVHKIIIFNVYTFLITCLKMNEM
jgi:hypothetical protein